MDIDKIAFTGSTGVGRSILKAAANSNLKKVTLELGGKSPNIVFNDADIAQAVSWAYFGYIFNAGQTCAAGTRVYVQEEIYDKFVEAFKARTAQTKLGDPFEADTFQGPQISQTQVDRIMGYVYILVFSILHHRKLTHLLATFSQAKMKVLSWRWVAFVKTVTGSSFNRQFSPM